MPKFREQFRPSFSKEELEQLLEAVMITKPNSLLYKKLNLYLVKVSVGINAASYVTMPKPSVEPQLGLERNNVRQFEGPNASAQYLASLNKKVELGAGSLMSPEERYNYLAGKVVAEEAITEEEREEGKKLELELYGMSMGVFEV